MSLELAVFIREVSHLLESCWDLALAHVLVLGLQVAVPLIHSVFLGTIPRVHFMILVGVTIIGVHSWGPVLLLVTV